VLRSDDGASSTQIAESSDRGMAAIALPANPCRWLFHRHRASARDHRSAASPSAGLRYGVSRNDYVPTIYERTDRRGLPASQIAWPTVPPGVSLCRGCTRAGERRRKPHLAHVSTPKSPQIGPSLTPSRSTLPPTRRVMPWRPLVYAGYRTHGLSKLRRSPRGLGILPRVFGNSLLVRGDSAGRTDRAACTRRSTGIRASPRA
jgi:hypothetical protein